MNPGTVTPLISILLWLGTPGHAAPQAAEIQTGKTQSGGSDTGEIRHTVLLAGNVAGVQTSRWGEDRELRLFFEFSDRGRGPRLNCRVRLDSDGIPSALATEGNDYLKAPVEERFALEGGQASWQSHAERGELQLERPAFYVGFADVPGLTALLARALLAAQGGALDLLPAGRATIERLQELNVRRGAAERTVTLYAISGLDFLPTYVWLDRDRGFFGASDGWLATIREGWEESLAALEQAQDKVTAARERRLVAQLAGRPAGPLAITAARLFDAETATVRPNMTVLIEGKRIRAVAPDGELPVPEGAELLDAAGRTLLPGLWDMHVHLSDSDGMLHLAAGVTSVRDLANETDKLLELKRKFEAGEAIGPRIVMAGFMDGPGPYAGPSKVLVATAEEARAAIQKYAKLGYQQIKIYSSIRPELVAGIIEQAHGLGLRVSGHVPAFMTAEQLVRLGFDELQHINFLFLNFWADEVQDTRTPLRFTAVAERAAEFDLESEAVRSFIWLLRERGVVVDPTLSIFEGMFLDRPGAIGPSFAAVAERLPPMVRRGLLGGGLPVPEGRDQRYRDSFQALLRMVRALYRAGVPLVAGTDNLAGFALHRELELYVEAGIPAPRVLQIATWEAAQVARRSDRLGSIAPGKLADLLLVAGAPDQRISDIRRAAWVLQDGTFTGPRRSTKPWGSSPDPGPWRWTQRTSEQTIH